MNPSTTLAVIILIALVSYALSDCNKVPTLQKVFYYTWTTECLIKEKSDE